MLSMIVRKRIPTIALICLVGMGVLGMSAATEAKAGTNTNEPVYSPAIEPREYYESVVASYTKEFYWLDHPIPYLRGKTTITNVKYKNIFFPNSYTKTEVCTGTRLDSVNHVTYSYYVCYYDTY